MRRGEPPGYHVQGQLRVGLDPCGRSGRQRQLLNSVMSQPRASGPPLGDL